MSTRLKIYLGFFIIFFGFTAILLVFAQFQQRNIVYSADGQREFIETLDQEDNYIDCNNEPSCATVVVEGDSGFKNEDEIQTPFSGFADPSIRKDPDKDILWISYSWPKIHYPGSKNQTAGIDTHLAYSDDSGVTWTFKKKLFESYETKNPQNGETGFINHEVVNILPVQNEDSVEWYSARLSYFLPLDGGFSRRPKDSYQLVLNKSETVEGLSDSESVIIGTTETHSEWGVEFDFSELSSQSEKCIMYNEPSLYSENNSLYLIFRCVDFNEGNLVNETSNILVFSSVIQESLKDFEWKYNGQLTSAIEARVLGGESLTQPDIVKNKDDELLLIISPESWNAQGRDFINYGCRAVIIESLDDPKLKRDSDGEIILKASIFSTDQGQYGPGSCTYDPNLKEGIMITNKTTTINSLTVQLINTSIHP